jgi:hypothetical protein
MIRLFRFTCALGLKKETRLPLYVRVERCLWFEEKSSGSKSLIDSGRQISTVYKLVLSAKSAKYLCLS